MVFARSFNYVYIYDAIMLMKFSLLSAFVGYYSVAYNELRCAMENLVRGVVFDLLALSEYRSKSEKLKEIKGFQGRSRLFGTFRDSRKR